MAKQRKITVEYRNVRLSIETYKKLDKYLIELIQKKCPKGVAMLQTFLEDLKDT